MKESQKNTDRTNKYITSGRDIDTQNTINTMTIPNTTNTIDIPTINEPIPPPKLMTIFNNPAGRTFNAENNLENFQTNSTVVI